MEPISTIVAGKVVDKLIDVVSTAVGTHVIERWSRHRAHEFFDQFCRAVVGDEVSDEELRLLLNRLLADDKRSEIVFDAYRSVCLTKSRSIGPRIIALLTAELVNAESIAPEADESIFAAAEQMSDDEFQEFASYVRDMRKAMDAGQERGPKMEHGSMVILAFDDMTDSNWRSDRSQSVGPMDLPQQIGAWALKLKQVGLVTDDVQEREWEYKEDGERHIDQDGVAREITWWLTLHEPALKLAALIDRIVPASRVFK